MATGPVSRTAATAPASNPGDLAGVLVELSVGRGRVKLGTAADALQDRRLTAAERAAIMALVRAVQLLRERAGLAGIDDAGRAVTLLLRDADATARGPWATTGQVAVGTRNGLGSRGGRARPNVLLTVDAAAHELAHVVQFGRMARTARPHAAILEGIADAVAILATGDDTLGEEFFNRDAQGRHQGAIRELGRRTVSGPVLGDVVTRYQDAIRPGTEEHAGGGVVAATFIALRERVGRDRAEQLLWSVIRDAQAWSAGGSWRELVLAMRRQAAATWAGDQSAIAAVAAALAATGLDAAVSARAAA